MKHLFMALLDRALKSKIYLHFFNVLIRFYVPFNAPHRLRIKRLSHQQALVVVPNIRSNHNHLKGIHAGCIVTAGEFAAGLLLLSNFSIEKYRLILSSLACDYQFQGKTDLLAYARVDKKVLKDIAVELKANKPAHVELISVLRDVNNNEVAQVRTLWQIKAWDQVKTKA